MEGDCCPSPHQQINDEGVGGAVTAWRTTIGGSPCLTRWGNELAAMREELVQHEAKEQRERREKRERREEEEEEARDGRLVEAKAYYISNKGDRRGVNFKTVARKFRVYQKDLKEAYWEWGG